MRPDPDDPQLAQLQAAWLAEPMSRAESREPMRESLHELGPRVRRRVDAETAAARRTLLFECLLTAFVFGAGVVIDLQRSRPGEGGSVRLVLWTLAVTHALLVWSGVLWLRHRTWRPLAETTEAYLALARRRATRQRVVARLGALLLTMELAGAWSIAWFVPSAAPVAGDVALLVSVAAVLLAPMLVRLHRRAVAQLRWVATIGEDPADLPP